MRRPRNLSAEERALWDSVAKQTKPLRKAKRKLAATLPSPLPAGGLEKKRPSPPTPSRHAKRALRGEEKQAPLIPPLSAFATGRGPGWGAGSGSSSVSVAGIERREHARLARGRRDIDARLDLHGMTQARAQRALLSFLQRAQADGCRYVLVITGKGKASTEQSERGVLRRQVPEWFALAEFRMLVTAYEEAAIAHGGAGALYVRVRRG